jgi:hypothetical protein
VGKGSEAGMSRSIGQLLARACERYSARPALVRRGEVRTYGELLERGARWLMRCGERGWPGDAGGGHA